MTSVRYAGQFIARLASRFSRDESGATAIEYALIAALISVAIVGALTTTGNRMNAVWTTVANIVKPNLAQ